MEWALVFLVIAAVAGIFSFAGIASVAAGFAKLLFGIALLIFLILLVLGLLAGRSVTR